MTIRDIAKLAEVSPATVSKVINQKADNISDETVERILSLVEKHNYVPYQKVVDQVSKQSNSVALLISNVSDIFCSELLRGVEDFFFSERLGVIVCNTDGKPEKEQRYIHMLKKQNVKGVIHFPMQDSVDESINKLSHENIFSVILDDSSHTPNSLKTLFNNKEGGRIATQHLIEKGHKRIGYIGPVTNKPYLLERYAGYKEAFLENQLDLDERIVYQGEDEGQDRRLSGYNGAKYLLSQKVTSIFCCDDHVAVGAYRAIQESNLRIPEDISVVGFDDSIFCELLEPNLTTVKQSAYEIGYKSAQMLFSKINDLPLEKSIVKVEPKLIERSSVSAPHAGRAVEQKRCVIIGDIRMDISIDLGKNALRGEHHTQFNSTKAGGWAVEEAYKKQAQGYQVYIAGYLGNDTYGTQIYNQLMSTGMKTDGLFFIQQAPTGTSIILENQLGEQSKIISDGVNGELPQYPLESISWILDSADECLCSKDLDDLEKRLQVMSTQKNFSLFAY